MPKCHRSAGGDSRCFADAGRRGNLGYKLHRSVAPLLGAFALPPPRFSTGVHRFCLHSGKHPDRTLAHGCNGEGSHRSRIRSTRRQSALGEHDPRATHAHRATGGPSALGEKTRSSRSHRSARPAARSAGCGIRYYVKSQSLPPRDASAQPFPRLDCSNSLVRGRLAHAAPLDTAVKNAGCPNARFQLRRCGVSCGGFSRGCPPPKLKNPIPGCATIYKSRD